MVDTLYEVVIYNIYGKREKKRRMRLLGGRMLTGERVILSKDVLPFDGKPFEVTGHDPDGTPRVQIQKV